MLSNHGMRAALLAGVLLSGLSGTAYAEKTVPLRTVTEGLQPGIQVPIAETVTTIAVTRDESYAYLAHMNADTLSILDLGSLELVGGVDVGDGPVALAVSPDNTLLWVVNFYGNSVWVVNLLTDTVESRIEVDDGPLAIALNSDGSKAYVANCFSGSISIIDEATRSVERTLWIGDYPQAIGVSPDDARIYVTHRQTATVEAFDANTGESLGRSDVGENPRRLAVVGSAVTVAAAADASLTVLDGATLEVQRTITVPPGPSALSTGIGENEVYVLSRDGRSITRCNIATGEKAVQTLGLGNYNTLAVARQKRRVFASRLDGPMVLGWSLGGEGTLQEAALVQTARAAPPMQAAPAGPSEKQVNMTAAVRAVPAAVTPTPRPVAVTPPKPTAPEAQAEVVLVPEQPAAPVEEELLAMAPSPAPKPPTVDDIVGEANVPPPITQRAPAADSEASPAPGTLLARVSEPLRDLRLRGRSAPVAQPIDASPVVLVSNAGARSLSVVDVRQSAVVGTIPLPDKPVAVTASSDGAQIYVAIEGRSELFAYARDEPNTPQQWPLDGHPRAVAVTPDGARVAVALADRNRCVLLDSRSGAVVHDVETGEWPTAVAISNDGGRAYVANTRGNSVVVIDLSTGGALQTWEAGFGPTAIALSPDGSSVAVVCSIDDEVRVLDANDGTLLHRADAGDRPQTLAFTPNGDAVYVANFLSASITRVAMADGATTTLECPPHPSAVTVSPNGEYLYVSNRFAGTVSLIQLSSGRVVSTFDVGDGPSALTLLAERHGT